MKKMSRLKKTHSKNFADDINKHIKDISEKYIIDKETAPFALMYVASEGVYQAIMNSDKEFTKLAREKNVVIVSPNTIFGFLKTYRLFIDNKEMSEKADIIQKEFAKIYEEITVFAERFSAIDKRNNQLSEDFRKLQISIDKISRRSERVKDLEFENSLGEEKKDWKYKMNIVIWDIETDSSNTFFGTIIEIGAILINDNFQELDKLNIRCRLPEGVVPQAGALLVNQSNVSMLTKANYSHYQMLQEVESTFKKWSPAVFLGYSNINFDDEMLRKEFFKGLRQPYLTNTNGNKRQDGLNIVRAAFAVNNRIMKTETNEKGNAVMKLESLARMNGIESSGFIMPYLMRT